MWLLRSDAGGTSVSGVDGDVGARGPRGHVVLAIL